MLRGVSTNSWCLPALPVPRTAPLSHGTAALQPTADENMGKPLVDGCFGNDGALILTSEKEAWWFDPKYVVKDVTRMGRRVSFEPWDARNVRCPPPPPATDDPRPWEAHTPAPRVVGSSMCAFAERSECDIHLVLGPPAADEYHGSPATHYIYPDPNP
jgi:hypothetical protein